MAVLCINLEQIEITDSNIDFLVIVSRLYALYN